MDKLLNRLLSDLVVEYHKLQGFHRYVKGRDFFQAHAKLEEYYDGVRNQIDEVAEVMLMLGMKPVSRLSDFKALSPIKEKEPAFVSSDDMLNEVSSDFSYLLEEVVEVRRAAEKAGLDLVSILMDGYIGSYSKAVWMIGQSM